jgi:hypothetical protein
VIIGSRQVRLSITPLTIHNSVGAGPRDRGHW